MHWFWRVNRRTFLVALTILALLMVAIGTGSFWIEFEFDAGAYGIDALSDNGLDLRACFCEGWLELQFLLGKGGGMISDDGMREWWGYYRDYGYKGTIHQLIEIPMWQPIILFMAYPTVAFIQGPFRRIRRRRKGLCQKCGYNLTGNVTGVCSECGERILH
jgi:hypothetical protein